MSAVNNKTERLDLKLPSGHGILYLKMLNFDGGTFDIKGKEFNQLFGFSGNINYNFLTANNSYLYIQLNSSFSNFNLTLTSGRVFLTGIFFTSFPNVSSDNVQNIAQITLGYPNTTLNSNITNYSNDMNLRGGFITLNMHFHFKGAAILHTPIILAKFNFSFPYNDSFMVRSTMSGDFYTIINSIIFGNISDIYAVSVPFYNLSAVKSGLYIAIYPNEANFSKLSPNGENFSISISFHFFKGGSVFTFKSENVLLQKDKIAFNLYGYAITGNLNTTILRLPFYPQMYINNGAGNVRYSTLFSLEQVIITREDTVSITVSYSQTFFEFFEWDAVLFAGSILIFRKTNILYFISKRIRK